MGSPSGREHFVVRIENLETHIIREIRIEKIAHATENH